MPKCSYCGGEIIGARKGQIYCGYSCSNRAKQYHTRQYDHDVTVWSCGGGVQSTAIAVLIHQGIIPKPGFSVMVDVGRERQSTWEYVYKWIVPKMEEVGVELKILKTTDYTDTDLFNNGCFVLPANRLCDNGKRYKMRTMCNEKWKVRVTRNYIRSHGVKSYTNLLGISVDEKRRTRESDKKYIKYSYPLIDLGLTRYGCMTMINDYGWEIPPHTHCWCCPNASNDEWFDLKINYPDDFRKAVELEREVRRQDPSIFLHCSLKPLDEAFM